ncbi:MAG: tetratricopeptide repeat protein [Prevotella sp.]|nr:tetratricopeptide repeat protein [Prevotella sp.]
MMKRLLLILSFCLLSSWAVAQDDTRVIDSIRSAMAKQEGYERAETMQELSRAFADFSFDECVSFGEKAIQESARVGDKGLLAQAYWKLGLSYLDNYDFDLANDYFNKALWILDGAKDTELLRYILDYKGRAELLMGEIDSALKTYQHDLKVSENLGDELNCADVINNMAYIYYQKDDIDKAMEYFENARQRYERAHDWLSVAQCDNNISNIYVEWQQFDKAKSLLLRAIPVFEQNGDEASLAHAYQNLGTIYGVGQVNLDSALYYLHKSILCAENVGDQIILIEDELELASVLKHQNKEKEALSLYQSALHSSEMMGYVKGMLESYKNIGIHYNNAGDFTTSAVYLKRCMDLAAEKGNQLYVNAIRPYLIADYARLGQLMEMKKELGLLHDNYMGIVNENNVLSEELSCVQNNMEGLLSQYETQDTKIETLQSQRNHYRLAFFGLLAIAIAVLVLFVAYKIVRKN